MSWIYWQKTQLMMTTTIFLVSWQGNYCKKKFIEGEITLDQRDFFINAIIAFYKKRLRYLLTKMNVENNTKPTKGSNIEYFVSWYSGILQFDDYEIEKVYEGRIWTIWIVYNWFTRWYSNGIWRRLQGV